MADHLAAGADALDETTRWLLEHGLADPNDALAGASPYLRLFSQVMGGWLQARSALAAQRLLASGGGGFDRTFLDAKVATARFYADNLLPLVHGLVAPATAGAADLFAIDPQDL
jgi:hypothetical protein